MGFRNTYIERNALVMLPFFLLVLAAGVDSIRRSATEHLQSLRSAQPSLIVFVSTPASVLNYYGLDVAEREVLFDDVVNTAPKRGGPPPGGSSLTRLKRVVNQVTAFGGLQNLPPPFLRGGEDEIILIPEPDDAIVNGVLRRTGTARFFLIRDTFWAGAFARVFLPTLCRIPVQTNGSYAVQGVGD